jgi:adenylate cyclase
MRGRCPHCAELNEYARAPTTAIVYCQHCRKPFGAASLVPASGHGVAVNAGAAVNAGPSGATGPQASLGALPLGRSRPQRGNQTPVPATDPISSPPGGSAAIAPGVSATAPMPNVAARTPVRRAPAPAEDTRPPRADLRSSGPGTDPAARVVDPVAARGVVPRLIEPDARDKPRLVYRSVEGLETEFVLEAETTIGRHPRNSVRLHDREVSKEHAVIERRADGFHLRDLGSSNGTFLNNELTFGSMILTLRIPSEHPVPSASSSVRDQVTILPIGPSGATHIHATLSDRDDDADFKPGREITEVDALRRDYDKLRIAHELSRLGVTSDFSVLLQRTLDVAFSILPADNGVVLLVDPETGVLVPHTVKRRDQSTGEIVLSSTIVNQVLSDRSSVLLSDAVLDPRFSAAQSIIAQGIRSAMVVPLVANNVVYGIMHLDSRQRIGAFTEKDLQLLKALANQAATSIANARLIRKVEDDQRTRLQLSRFLPPHVVEAMVQGKGQTITKGGRECDASVLFCDIRGFTTMSESSSAPEIVALLNEYFERLVEVVFERGGVLDKFIGDAMMAHWGTLVGEETDDHATKAVIGALGLRDAIRELNRERSIQRLPPIGMGVGVNSGPLVAGYMGARRRLEYTVIGDTVNTASRLCGLAQADQVVMSETTYQRVAGQIEARYLGTRQVKGKEQSVKIYEAIAVRDDTESPRSTGS